MKIQIVTFYVDEIIDGETWRRPASFMLGLKNFTDVTARPNPLAGQPILAEHEATLAQITTLAADTDHTAACILHRATDADNTPPDAEHTGLRAILANRGLNLT